MNACEVIHQWREKAVLLFVPEKLDFQCDLWQDVEHYTLQQAHITVLLIMQLTVKTQLLIMQLTAKTQLLIMQLTAKTQLLIMQLTAKTQLLCMQLTAKTQLLIMQLTVKTQLILQHVIHVSITKWTVVVLWHTEHHADVCS